MRPSGTDLRIYLHRAPVDMRKGRNGLAALAQETMKLDPFSGSLFVYVGRRSTHSKSCTGIATVLHCGASGSRVRRSITGHECCRRRWSR